MEGKEVSSGMKQLSLTDGNDEWKTHLNLQDNNGMPFEGQQAPIQPIPLTHGPRPSWLLKLRQWLPKFLAGACARLGEGEYYPLSSLKGDFRATCGLELDHLAVGYPKLSDFVRSLHDICRMKIVPVGRGPATHMVLLPLGKLITFLGVPINNVAFNVNSSRSNVRIFYLSVTSVASRWKFPRRESDICGCCNW